jgi:hypothetical protein
MSRHTTEQDFEPRNKLKEMMNTYLFNMKIRISGIVYRACKRISYKSKCRIYKYLIKYIPHSIMKSKLLKKMIVFSYLPHRYIDVKVRIHKKVTRPYEYCAEGYIGNRCHVCGDTDIDYGGYHQIAESLHKHRFQEDERPRVRDTRIICKVCDNLKDNKIHVK